MAENTTIGSFLNGRDTISTKDAKIYITINGKVIPLIEANKFSAKLEKNKEDVQTLGSRWKHKKTTSVEGTGTLGGYLISSNWSKYALPYINGGKDLYFEATLTINDPTSAAGTQTLHFTDVNLDDVPFADFEADDDVMQWESDFTFEGVSLIQAFTGFDL
ncbi:phage tail tube protein [Lactiplantibacillus paraplantarum]|uniref:Phage tail protein n=1 Tax=Lactiplantibacillus paraplantarum TaxID=60520 RepID=A0AAD0X8A3_9LACO|nr:phage tail tube protein [Lactiplantibacillus paraplantarum]AYJ38874.1 phage tail protein [Lactiplantibacillus paraplantarum]AYJ38928.1 phage tail protein [Lactiplantibacillus paraplantarum]KRL51358.1 phage core tail protein [Lactiplantibacillus paraplantarum DSM 10667]MCU4683966.1 phage tail tube protein [Lactiplantibacillus paraplantarum]MDL2061098.1 phage tail tube protein [Lactiplantibacillus paraplantarum]